MKQANEDRVHELLNALEDSCGSCGGKGVTFYLNGKSLSLGGMDVQRLESKEINPGDSISVKECGMCKGRGQTLSGFGYRLLEILSNYGVKVDKKEDLKAE